MAKSRPIFITGAARTGTTLLAKALDAHPEMLIASDLLLPLFRALRSDIISRLCSDEERQRFDPAAPIGSGYYTRLEERWMSLLWQGDLTGSVDNDAWPSLLQRIQERANHESPDIAPALSKLDRRDFKATLDSAFQIIEECRSRPTVRWVGLKEVWILDFVPLLIDAYPEARFIGVIRDPRATCASASRLPDESQRPHLLSFAQHCRKHLALSYYLSRMPKSAEKILLVRHEDFVEKPEEISRKICDFLEVPYSATMIEPNCMIDYSTGGRWAGNSSYTSALSSISKAEASSWKHVLESEEKHLIEFVCGYEMGLFGYHSDSDAWDHQVQSNVLKAIRSSEGGTFSWRTDFQDSTIDVALEWYRHVLVQSPESADRESIERCFLFPSVFEEIIAKRGSSRGEK